MTDSTLPSGIRLAEPPASARPALSVTAVVVTRGPTRYLAPTLKALGAQTRAPGRVVVVDVAATADEDVLRLARGAFAGVMAESAPEIVAVPIPGARTFGAAVRGALATLAPPSILTSVQTPSGSWLWLLHDDSAPEPDALAELLRAVEHAPSVGVAGVKQRTWTDPARLLEVGVRTSRSGRRMTGVEDAEVDQGQHDGRDDVLGVGIAGALVRRDVWDELDGPDPALGPFGDGFDLSRRARLAGHRVVVVPSAVVRHAQATYHGLRGLPGAEVDADGDGLPDTADPRRSFAARRRALLHQRLVTAPLLLMPLVAFMALAAGAVRSLVRIATKEPLLAVTEVTAPLAVLARPGAVLRARRHASRTRRVSRRTLRPLQASWREVVREWRDRRLAHAEERRIVHAPSELELRELAALATRRRATLGALAAVLVGVSVMALGPVTGVALGGWPLVGGALAPATATVGELWQAATSGWVAGGLGDPGPADALLTVLLPAAALGGGSLSVAVGALMLGSVLLSGLGAWFAAGAATRSVGVRMWAALVWAAAPALLLGLGDGRLGAVVAHMALPWLALGLARATGSHEVDIVVPGVATARRRDAEDEPVDGAAPSAADVEPVTGEVATVEASSHDDAGPTATVPVLARPRGASTAAAAAAALAFAVMVAGAPVLLVPGLVVVLGVALCARRGRFRVLLAPVPGLVLLAPLLVEAAGRGVEGLRLLVADPGVPHPSEPASAVELLLGVPSDASSLVPAWAPVLVAEYWPWAWGAVVLAMALLALLRGAPVARAVRLAWAAAAAGLATAAVSGMVDVAIADGALVRGWPGAGVSFAGAGLVAAAVLGGRGLRERIATASFGWRQPAAVLGWLVAGAVVVASLGGWAWQARSEGLGDVVALERLVVPAVGQQAQAAPRESRVLMVEAGPDGVVAWQLARGDGPLLVDQSSAVWTRTVEGPLQGAHEAPSSEPQAGLHELVARIAAATSGDVALELAQYGIGDVLAPPLPVGAAAQSVAARADLVARLDATAGLERITENAAGTIWRVQAAAAPGESAQGTVTTWARLSEPGNPSSDVPLDAHRRAVDTQIPAGSSSRRVVLAERHDAGWTATLDGRVLPVAQDDWRQAFTVGADGGRLVVGYERPNREPWLAVQGSVALLTLLLALPLRRRKAGRR
ncbi:glycosyltransferase [Cellulomonas chengniuliangii]|uniref:glycosyltransferase n=1 Tax=Cellulomonas chengniuliangii TaxID=2968084 RepID=UPI001D0E3CF1|nr:glycosyltransferase [Cellulomonas chengniuliangii]MCC2316920.1 glycosyltransferase [Cellulomonas chengniuliangii]